jgi:lipoyl synthase
MNPLKKKPRTKSSFQEAPEKPDWLRVKLRFPQENDTVADVRQTLDSARVHTVCESASCPNLNHCWSRKSATFMLNGDICTRRCSYCDVASGKPKPPDQNEPENIAESCRQLGLNYVVLTSVNRDDLADGGASQFANTISAIRSVLETCKIEVLVPDFKGKQASLDIIYSAKPNIINHNIETVESLFHTVAPQKNYHISLSVLKNISEHGFITKSGIILGLGETVEEVEKSIRDLRSCGVSMLTIGQYLQPTPTHYPVKEYVSPILFNHLKKYALSLGFRHVESGALVRSSYHAEEQTEKV